MCVCAVAAKKSDVSAIESVLPQHEHIHTDWLAWSMVLDEPTVQSSSPCVQVTAVAMQRMQPMVQ